MINVITSVSLLRFSLTIVCSRHLRELFPHKCFRTQNDSYKLKTSCQSVLPNKKYRIRNYRLVCRYFLSFVLLHQGDDSGTGGIRTEFFHLGLGYEPGDLVYVILLETDRNQSSEFYVTLLTFPDQFQHAIGEFAERLCQKFTEYFVRIHRSEHFTIQK